MRFLRAGVLAAAGWCGVWLGSRHCAAAAEWHVAPAGKADAAGTRDAPWDLASTLSGGRKVTPGDTVWIAAGDYRHPNRAAGAMGYEVRLAGQPDRPVRVRALPGVRATIDGGLCVQAPSAWLWIEGLEILVSENTRLSRRMTQPGSSPADYNRPWGGLNVYAGDGCKFINLVIHDNAQGISWWSGSTESEVYGSIIYDNGWDAPDRGHGHAVYTQNQQGVKTISDCIMTGGYGYTMHAYGSSRAYVDNYHVEGNIAYDAGTFLIGGGRPSRNIVVRQNYLHNLGMQIGYSAPKNEDCDVRDNLILGGTLQINKYQRATSVGNVVLAKEQERPRRPPQVIVRPNRYDAARAHVVVFNWPKQAEVELPAESFLKPGERYALYNPRALFGRPVAEGVFDGKPIRLAMKGEFTALVLLKPTAVAGSPPLPAKPQAVLAADVAKAGWIVCSAKDKGDWDFWAMRPDGSQRRNLTRTPQWNEAGVRVSPDGSKLLYYRMDRTAAVANNTYGNYELAIAPADGRNPVVLGKGYNYATWGPDGKQLAYLEKGGIKILDLASRKVVRELPGLRLAQQLTWSPDGKWFCATANNLGPYWNIGRIDAQSGAINVVSEIDRFNCTPDWLPDSRRIVYARGIIPEIGGQAEMWLADGDGRNRRILYAEDGMNIYGACSSPDGKYLVFTRSVEDMGVDDAVGTWLTVIRWSDTPMIGPASAKARRAYPNAKPGPRLDLGHGWEPHWTATDLRPAAEPGGLESHAR